MAELPNYIVIRAHPDLPPGFLPRDLEGRWFDGTQIPAGFGWARDGDPGAVAVPTGQFEVRDSDGAVAEVWEVRP